MCDWYRVGGRDCESVAELRAALPAAVFAEGATEDECLCSVDHEATEAATGATIRRATDEEGWPWPTYIIETQPEPPQ